MTERIRQIIRDGRPVMKLCCPGCGRWADIDEDQFYGSVSVECTNDGCDYHKTVDWSKEASDDA